MSKPIPEITQTEKFNLLTSIWIVPMIALVIAGWLAYQHFVERGPEIKIIFSQNEGLIAGKSVVKFKNVPVGKVTDIYPEEGVDGVVVVVRMNSKASAPYLSEYAKFWIVKPEVGLSGISGLDTLISGTYISAYSKAGGKKLTDKFIGLPQPYRDDLEGEYFHLRSQNGDNVAVGTPIYFKNIRVGQVEYLYLGLDNTSIDIIVFIDRQYTPYISDDSKFWMKSIVNVDFTKGNMDVNIAPLNHVLQGGIAFSSTVKNSKCMVSDQQVFNLYRNKTQAESQVIGSEIKYMKKFILHASKGISGLHVQAPVRFDGFDIGSVENVELSYNKNLHKILGRVLLKIDTSVFKEQSDVNSSGEMNFYEAVEEGLRAKIVSLDPITGSQYVDLTFEHNDPEGTIIQEGKYARLPMATQGSGDIMTSLTQILDKLNHLPLNELVISVANVIESTKKPVENANVLLEDLQATIKNINRLTSKKSFEILPDELSNALKEMTKTLKNTSKVVKGYDSDSLVKQQLAQTLEVLTKTSQEMQYFLRMLNRKPNSLIFGDN